MVRVAYIRVRGGGGRGTPKHKPNLNKLSHRSPNATNQIGGCKCAYSWRVGSAIISLENQFQHKTEIFIRAFCKQVKPDFPVEPVG